jgi:hypothetical protein
MEGSFASGPAFSFSSMKSAVSAKAPPRYSTLAPLAIFSGFSSANQSGNMPRAAAPKITTLPPVPFMYFRSLSLTMEGADGGTPVQRTSP